MRMEWEIYWGQGNHLCLILLISLRKESGAEEGYLWKEK
jgi:hypothetical protein